MFLLVGAIIRSLP